MPSSSFPSFGLIGLSVALSVSGQLILKIGVGKLSAIENFTAAAFGEFLRQALFSPLVLFGFVLYALSAALWLVVISRLELSYAYPFLALNFVLLTVFSRVVLSETIPMLRWIGILLICVGILFVARSGR